MTDVRTCHNIFNVATIPLTFLDMIYNFQTAAQLNGNKIVISN